MEYAGFWKLLVSIWLLMLVVVELAANEPWRFSFDGSTLTLISPWGGILLAADGCCRRTLEMWTGIVVYRRIVGPDPGGRVFEEAFRHELRRREWVS